MEIRNASVQDIDIIADIEQQCFPEAEACSRTEMLNRLQNFGERFWIGLEDNTAVTYIGGMVSGRSDLCDEMYADAAMHEPDGAWQMLFSVCTVPSRQHCGYAGQLMRKVIDDCFRQGKRGIVLTCKDRLIGFYHRFGYVSEGVSASDHGGAVWYQMRLRLDGPTAVVTAVVEDDFGCEGLPEGTEKQVTIRVQWQDGHVSSIRMDDKLAMDRQLDVGDRVLLVQDGTLIRLG